MANPLEIQILARLNESLSTTEINKSLKKIAKDVGINVSIDQNELNKLTKQIEQLQRKIKQQSGSTPIFDATKSEQEIKQFEMSIDRTVKKIKDELNGLGTIKTTQFLRGEEQDLQSFIVEVKKAEGIIEKFKYTIDTSTMIDNAHPFKLDTTTIVDDTNKVSQKFNEAKQKIVDDLKVIQSTGNVTGTQISKVMQSLQSANDLKGLDKAKQDLKELASLAKLAQQMADGREKAAIKAANEEKKLAESQAIAANKNIETSRQEAQAYEQWWLKALHDREIAQVDLAHKEALVINKEIDKQRQQNVELEKTIELYKKASQVQVANLQRRYGDTLNESQLNKYNEAVKNLSIDTPDVSHKMKELNIDLRNISATAKTSTTHVLSMGEALKTALERFPIWMLAATAFYAPLRAIESGISTIHALDDALTSLKKVTNETAETYRDFAVNVNKSADEIGASTSAYIDSVTEFARLGQNLAQAKASAQQAMIYANVGDFGGNSQNASRDLIATMKAYNLEFDTQGKNLQKIVDLLNNIGNKYAIDSAGIGDAMRRSAASLAVAGNSIEQSVALITAANNSIQDPAQVGTALTFRACI